MTRPAPELLRELLFYEPETGKLFWRGRRADHFEGTERRTAEHSCAIWNSRYAGKEAFTSTDTDGRKYGTVLGRTMRAHHAAWAVHHGEWPVGMVDHHSGDSSNNSATNLRDATLAQNNQNTKAKGGSSRFKGVCWHKKAAKWSASITLKGKAKHLGLFSSEEDAARTYDAAAVEAFGRFARTNADLNLYQTSQGELA